MNIEISNALRPCIVTFGKQEAPRERYNALLHFWAVKQHPKDAMLVGETAGQVSFPIGIVEYEDGSVHEIRPQHIRFIDNACADYRFEGDGNE